ncbi:glycosyltransferase family 2 protein [Haladaptatus pallidirubidus]|uniref:Glycosyltransferase 2-like domain-containing protein n=1 Tax=Haladaptatus pallidirubidus TaxID=1008152 RepID=A0AAV3UCJ5_9EURY|nr:glycosyltransferase family A protein [Haladaptatus pallidirubidus]
MLESPLVSVIIPTLNRPRLVESAVKSVSDQTYEKIEIIVVDDSDYSSTSPPSFEETNIDITVLQGETSEGLPHARNRGIEAASGELVAFLDDDDEWKTKKTEKQVRRFKTRDIGLCTSWRYMVGSDNKVENVAKTDIEGDLVRKLLCQNVIGPPSGVMVRQDVIDSVGAFDEEFLLWEDREWYLRVAQVYDVDCVEEPLVRYALDSPEKMSGNLTMARNTAYPQLLDKHDQLIKEYERRFVQGWKFRKFGKMAYDTGSRVTALRYAVQAIATYPRAWPFYRLFIRSLIGDKIYALLDKTTMQIRNAVKRWKIRSEAQGS